MVKNRLFVVSILLLAIISVGFASANTIIVGKIYNSDYSSTIEGASVNVQIGSDDLDTTSLSDGTYAVIFPDNFSAGTEVKVTANKAGFIEKKESGVITTCDGSDCEENYISVINLGMSATSSGGGSHSPGGGSSTHYYQCGNGVCNSGETAGTCPSDCKANNTNLSAPNLGTELDLNQSETEDNQSSTNFLTGSAIAGLAEFATSGAGIATGLGLITILIGSIALVNLRKKKVVKNNSGSN